MTGTKMSPVLCGTIVLLMAAGFLRAEEGYGSGRPAVGGGNFGGYAGGLATAGGGGNNVGPTGVAGGYGGSAGGGAGYNNNNNNGGAGGYGGSTGGGAGGSYDGGELGEPHPYSFQYEVKDPPSGNDYSQQESSDGNTVTGEYRVLLPDGRRQIVKYTANDATGYVADVQYEGEANFVQPTGPGGNYNNNNQQGGGFDSNNQVGYNDNQGGGYNNNNNQQGGGYNNQQGGGYNNQQPGGSGGYSYRR